jgi:hypothetical protein
VQFDARAAKLLRAGQHLVVGGCPGLRLEVTPSTKTWTYRYKSPLDGRMKQAALGQWPRMGIMEAAQAWQEKRQQRGEGAEPGKPKKDAQARAYSVSDLAADYLAGHIDSGRGEAGAHKGTPTAAAKLRGLLGGAWDYALDAGRLDGTVADWWRVVHRGRLKSRGKIVGGEHQGQSRRVLHVDEVKALLAWLPNLAGGTLSSQRAVSQLLKGRLFYYLVFQPQGLGESECHPVCFRFAAKGTRTNLGSPRTA